MNSAKLLSLIILFIPFPYSCKSPQPRYPINVPQDSFMSKSIHRNQQQYEIEIQQILRSIAKDSTINYTPSKQGFWYGFPKSRNLNQPLIQPGDFVSLSMQIESLDGQLIYDWKEAGTISYHVSKQEILPILREGVLLMKYNELAVFLSPSYLCFGYTGDGDKIAVNQPLKVLVKVGRILKNK